MYFFLWGPLISSGVYQKAYLHFLLFPTPASKFPFNYWRLNKCPDTCGFQTRNLCRWPHATLLPTPVHTSCDVTHWPPTVCTGQHAQSATRPHFLHAGHLCPPAWGPRLREPGPLTLPCNTDNSDLITFPETGFCSRTHHGSSFPCRVFMPWNLCTEMCMWLSQLPTWYFFLPWLGY